MFKIVLKRSKQLVPVFHPLHSGTCKTIYTGNSTLIQFYEIPLRLFQNYISNSDPEVLSRLSAQQGMSPDMIKTATDMIKTMKPEELQKMFQVASSLNQTGPLGPNPAQNLRPNMPEMSPEMVKMASETISRMSPEDLQRMMSTASSSLGVNRGGSSSSSEGRSEGGSPPSVLPDCLMRQGATERADSSVSAADADLQEAARSTMNDPAMRQVWCLFAILKFLLGLSLSLFIFFLFLSFFWISLTEAGKTLSLSLSLSLSL
jgi:hypothetical protein